VWQLWRQDDNGNRVAMERFDDRVAALARWLEFESGPQHRQTYWVEGPSEAACTTNRDLYLRLVAAGDRAGERSLDEYLRAWWRVGRAVTSLELDMVAAMFTAAAVVEPAPMRPAWRTATFPYEEEPSTREHWEAIVLSQIADLADLGPLPPYASLGLTVKRPAGVRRATDLAWYNFDPRAYLECGMAGTFGGWDFADGTRKPVNGPVHPDVPPDPGVEPLGPLLWADLAELARNGQEYE
jgi:hypothetical protein